MKNSTLLCSLTIITALLVCPFGVTKAQTADEAIIDVGVILDLNTWVGKMTSTCVNMALDDYYSAHNSTTRLVLHTRDSHRDIVAAASSAIDLIKNVQVQAILGPQSSSQAVFIADIGSKAQVPIISFSATSPSISFTKTPYFIRTALNDSAQVKAISAIIETFGWREVVPIYEDTDYGKDMIPYLSDAVQDINARVAYRSVLSPSFTDNQIKIELYKLMNMPTRVFVVHLIPPLASRLFSIAKEIEMMTKGYVWIITDGLTDLISSTNASIGNSMQGVLGIKPYVPRTEKLDKFRRKWRRKILHDYLDIDEAELDVLGLWAYDSVWALAKAFEKIIRVGPPFNKSNAGNSITDLEALGTSQTGQKLLESLLQTKINGLSGEFWLKDGQLQSSAFQIVNVNGNGKKEIGFWSPALGISKSNVNGNKNYTNPRNNLGAIIWPGDTTEVPKGWEMPTGGKRLKIGVPVKDGFFKFVKMENATTVTGFVIDMFKTVMNSLPYAIAYDLIPYAEENGQNAGTYNDLVEMVYSKKYDAVVGDVTISPNRSQLVDFTLPYSESGVGMVVPMKNDKNAWIFLKPLTRELWLTIVAFFIFTGFIVWVLEHRINKDFRGRPSEQVSTMFWFSFSTLVFSHKEKVTSNLARFVVIIWVFVVLILSSSYTASLASMLTVQKLQPTVKDIGDLKGDFVGYQSGSLVKDLMEDLGLDKSKFRSYKNEDEYHEALSKGSKNGGVSAIIDETPYIKLFLAKHCSKYAMVGKVLETPGFGFAFPKGSPLVPDISRAILQVTDGEKMDEIENEWFGKQVCPKDFESLDIDSFKGLFLITGVVSASAFIIFSATFLYEQKNILASEGSISQKIAAVAAQFDKEKDTSSSGSRQKNPSNRRITVRTDCAAAEYNTSGSPGPATSVSLHNEMRVFTQENLPYSESSTPTRDLPDETDIFQEN